MNWEVKRLLAGKGVDILRFVDLSILPEKDRFGFDKAVLIGFALSKAFILDVYRNRPVEDEYLKKESDIEKMADWLADELNQRGYRAHSQSEKSIVKCKIAEPMYLDLATKRGFSVLPQKTVARLGGLGFIGKNNLLITEKYGCALVLCSVLTDAPITADHALPVPQGCGMCNRCVEVCETKALSGKEWRGERCEVLIDVERCCCALKCMVACPYTLHYARS